MVSSTQVDGGVRQSIAASMHAGHEVTVGVRPGMHEMMHTMVVCIALHCIPTISYQHTTIVTVGIIPYQACDHPMDNPFF